jgi:hypothetical protein
MIVNDELERIRKVEVIEISKTFARICLETKTVRIFGGIVVGH